MVRDNVYQLIKCLSKFKANHSKQFYYEVRSWDRNRTKHSTVERAARTIYLNKTCYNGLYRVNSKGQFNVPMGSYKNPQILYPETLIAASIALQNAKIKTQDYYKVIDLAQPGDFIYFDPPYQPVSKTANFTSYTAGNFGEDDQRKLAEVFFSLSEKRCLCMLSNSDTPLINELYAAFSPLTITANWAINSDANGRVGIKEVLVINYDASIS